MLDRLGSFGGGTDSPEEIVVHNRLAKRTGIGWHEQTGFEP